MLYCTNSLDLLSVTVATVSACMRFFEPDLVSSLAEFMKSFAAAHLCTSGLWTKDVFRANEATEQLACQQMSQGSLHHRELSCTDHAVLGWASLREVIAADDIA